MDLSFFLEQALQYKSQSQKIRVLTENWVNHHIYCPNCGRLDMNQYPNNRPVADFFCSHCREEYELKSKKGVIGEKIVDGAYRTMIERLQSNSTPNFFLLNYSLKGYEVTDFLVIPKHFFVPEIIEKRNPLAPTARRAGWVGCNVLIKSVPQSGKIYFVRNRLVEPKQKVLAEWQRTLFLREEKQIKTRGWILDVMSCIEKIGSKEFSLNSAYSFENELSKKHPENKHIKDKIRQQLQVLRDKGYIEFIGRGRYRRT